MMNDNKGGGKAGKFFSDHGEKVGLGVAAALLLAYLVMGVMMAEEDQSAVSVERAIAKNNRELSNDHPEKQAPQAANYAEAIAYWNTVKGASGADNFTGTLLPNFDPIAVEPKKVKIAGVKVPAVSFGGAEVALDSVTLNWSAEEFSRLDLKKWARSKEFDVFEIEEYTVERMVGESGEWKEVTKVPASVTTYRDTDINPRTLYSYRITSHVPKDEKFNRAAVKGMTVGTPSPVRTMGIWQVSFANAMKGMAYVTIEKFDKSLGGKVAIKHIHHAGDKIGWWKEGGGEPVSKHRVSLKGGTARMVDWNSGMALKSVTPSKVKVTYDRCKPKFDKQVGAKIGCDTVKETVSISSNEIVYTDEEGKEQKVFSPDPYTNPRAADQKCEEHGGRPRRRSTKKPAEAEGALPGEDPAAAKARLREEEAAKLFKEAEALEKRSVNRALDKYEKLLKEYLDTEFVGKQKKTIIEERLVRLRK